MTAKSSNAEAREQAAGDDQVPYEYEYGHGRMPFFMKLVWLAFLAFGAWYVVSFLLAALGEDLGVDV
ncbi:MAG: hypothetical protein DHS20C15_29680 [Planctomycetota bacterium]|nr:MAG: hypothetical protein DHS20C15_29680 [Planctomycetota bacterium]